MSELYEAFRAKLHVLADLIRSKTFVLATDKNTHMYIQRRGLTAHLQVAALKDMLINLEVIIRDVEATIEEEDGEN